MKKPDPLSTVLNTSESSASLFLPSPEKVEQTDDPFQDIANLVVASVRRLDLMATRMEQEIRPGVMSPAELSRSVRTAAHLRTLIIKEGGKVAGDVKAMVGKGRREVREA